MQARGSTRSDVSGVRFRAAILIRAYLALLAPDHFYQDHHWDQVESYGANEFARVCRANSLVRAL